ncbi:hypothetical protein HGRIS_005719 [Hohenbuehelia grisea]|uniref:Uncharacterized protein n=1 Tax=Hohenbuehelia grisea TaxID=104357 RepID=A0ABR3JXP3_9AGAR
MSSTKERQSCTQTPPETPAADDDLESYRRMVAEYEDVSSGMFSHTIDFMLNKESPNMGRFERLMKVCVDTASREIKNLLLGPYRDRVLASIEKLRENHKNLSREDFVLKMFIEPPDEVIQRRQFQDAVVASWEEEYRGGGAVAFWDYIRYNFRPHRERYIDRAEGRVYAHYVVLFQSSGTGKSRLVDELSKTVFVIPMCLRDNSCGFPPADLEVRKYLSNQHDFDTTNSHCSAFMSCLFRHTAEVLAEGEFKDLNYAQTALLFRQRMTENMMIDHNAFRRTFYSDVIRKSRAYIEQMAQTSKDIYDGSSSLHMDLYGHLLDAWKELEKVLEGKEECQEPVRHWTEQYPRVLLSFDESHDLPGTRKRRDKYEFYPSAFLYLRASLSLLTRYPVFAIFVSSANRFPLIRFPEDDHSSRVYTPPSKLVPPYCDIDLDVLAHDAQEKLDLSGKWTLRRVADDSYMTLLGRPLFGAMYRHGSPFVQDNLLEFAKQKLANVPNRAPAKINMDQATACLGFRLPLEFYSRKPDNADKEVKQVESHLRICVKPSTDSESMLTISPSEPFLSEAAASVLRTAKWDTTGEAIRAIEILKELMTESCIDAGDRGELIALLLLTLARDQVVLGRPNAERTFSLIDFMSEVIPRCSSTDTHLHQMASDFPAGMIHFNHFIKPQHANIIHRDFLLLLMGRGAGVLCAPDSDTPRIDIALPFLVHNDVIQASNAGAILIQVQNDKKYTVEAQPGLFTEMDPYEVGVLRAGDPAVPLIKVFMALSSQEAGVTIVRHAPGAGYNAVVYDVWIAGLSPDVDAPIAEADQSIWATTLAVPKPSQSTSSASVEEEAQEDGTLHPLSLAGAGDHVDHWRRWVDLDATPLELTGKTETITPGGTVDDGGDAGVSNGDAVEVAQVVQAQTKASTSGSSAHPTKRAKRC